MEERSKRLTYDEVANVCHALHGTGANITQDIIYSIFKRGSLTTINKFLKQWESEKLSNEVKLSISLIRSLEAEMRRVSSRENAEINSLNIVLKEENRSLDMKLKAFESENEKLKNTIALLKAESENEKKKYESSLEAEKLISSSLSREIESVKKELHNIMLNNVRLQTTLENNVDYINTLKKDKTDLNKGLLNKIQEVADLQVAIAKLK